VAAAWHAVLLDDFDSLACAKGRVMSARSDAKSPRDDVSEGKGREHAREEVGLRGAEGQQGRTLIIQHCLLIMVSSTRPFNK
jgi:hypothetical protein